MSTQQDGPLIVGKLVLSAAGKVLRELIIARKRLSIGRRAYNDLALDDLTVSGEHAVVHWGNGEAVIHDLKSRNGTLVNGVPVMQQTLVDGDVLDIGVYRLIFRLERMDNSDGPTSTTGPITEAYRPVRSTGPDTVTGPRTESLSGPATATASIAGASTPAGTSSSARRQLDAEPGFFVSSNQAPDSRNVSGASTSPRTGDSTSRVAGITGIPLAPGRAPFIERRVRERREGGGEGRREADGARQDTQGRKDASGGDDFNARQGGTKDAGSHPGTRLPDGAADASHGAPGASDLPGLGTRRIKLDAIGNSSAHARHAARFGIACVRYLNGREAGRELLLQQPLVSLRNGEGQVAVIARRSTGYFLTHVEGLVYPQVNGESIGLGTHRLKSGDLIELAGTIVQFKLER